MRGMARQGPMERYTRMVNTMANTGCTRPASLSRPPARATATTPAMGRPTALTARPAKAGQSAQMRREDQVPGSEKHGKQCKADQKQIFAGKLLHRTDTSFLSCIKDDRDLYSSVYRFMHFMSRKKNMKKSNDRHDKLLCIMMHGSLAFGKRYGIIMYNVELSRPSGRFLREIRGFQLPPCCLMATGSYPRIIR